MADTKISALPASTTPLAGTEVLPIVQGGATKQVSVANLTAGRAISATEVTLSTGNLVIGTAGKGIDFSATPGTGTSELLADYEEGTWTPTFIGDSVAGTTTYTSQIGAYTKVGRQVTLTGEVSVTATTGSGGLLIGGLPFNNSSSFRAVGAVMTDGLNWTGGTMMTGYMALNATAMRIYGSSDDGVLTAQNITNETAAVYFTLTYFV